ncbi:MAG: TonB-dependent receptor family protein, partial [Paludibacteraceae bacterium]|nr:TonB-dependent receptor family protein [Paludibacteraceae bacterium]
KSVEVITNPSAKYNPEGNAGIINIVMKEDSQRGYFGNVTAGANYREGSPYPGGQAGLNLNYNESKWSFNLNSNLRYNRRDRGSHLDRKNFTDTETTYLKQDSKNAFQRLNGFLRLGFNYNITTVDEIGVTAYGMMGGTRNSGHIDYTDLDATQTVTRTRERDTGTDGILAFYNITANYKHSFIKDIHDISASVNYNGNIRNSESRYFTNAYKPDLSPIPDAKVRQRQTLDSKANNASVQVDYMNKVAKDHKIEAGLKADIKFSDSYDHTYDSIFTKNKEEEDFSKYNPFNYWEQIYAAYVNYAAKFNWFSLQVGLRCEETITHTKSIVDEVHRSYFQPFPSVYFGFDLGKSNTLQLSYTRRINRPRGNRINSFVDRSDPSNLRHGNPLLMPEFGNVVELNYLKDWEMHSLSASLFYNYTENVIQQVSRLITTDVMETTYENITYSQSAGAELVAKNRLFKNYLDLTTTISAYYYQLGANEEYKIKRTDSFSWNARINANVKIISNLSAQISAYYNSPRIVAQGSVDQNYGLDLGIKANFLNKKLSISFSVKDVLDSRKKGRSITESTNFHQESFRTSCDRSYRLTLTYNFGNMKSKNKDKKNGDRNDADDFDDDL